MVLSPPAPRALDGSQKRSNIAFDFVLEKHPRYQPNSGPPLAPLSIMLPHDKDGIIVDRLKFDDGELRYIVSYETTPVLRVSVKPQNLLDWVSRRTFEEYEAEQTDLMHKQMEVNIASHASAKKRRRTKGKHSTSSHVVGQDVSLGKRKHSPGPDVQTKIRKISGPGRRNRSSQEEVIKSPKAFQHSQRPSLSTPAHGLVDPIVIDTDSDEGDEGNAGNDDLQISRQLDAGHTSRSTFTSQKSSTRSSEGSVAEPPELAPLGRDLTYSSRERSRTQRAVSGESRGTSSSDNNSKIQTRRSSRLASRSVGSSSKDPSRRSSVLPGNSSVAATSSREIFDAFEDIEQETMERRKSRMPTLAEKYSHINFSGKKTQFQRTIKKPRKPTPPIVKLKDGSEDDEDEDDEDDEDDEENTHYSVKSILKHKTAMFEDKRTVIYLIDWEGNWEPSWEPARNVGIEVINEYEAKLKREHLTRKKVMRRSFDTDSGEGDRRSWSRLEADAEMVDVDAAGPSKVANDDYKSASDNFLVGRQASGMSDPGTSKENFADIPQQLVQGQVLENDEDGLDSNK
ncbi:hypothetical protein B7494_g4393 [Chlorociboria aeruginascens]|nr:hypothetical protein B7494_g4393 [Chlorociboria aeruginascens]